VQSTAKEEGLRESSSVASGVRDVIGNWMQWEAASCRGFNKEYDKVFDKHYLIYITQVRR